MHFLSTNAMTPDAVWTKVRARVPTAVLVRYRRAIPEATVTVNDQSRIRLAAGGTRMLRSARTPPAQSLSAAHLKNGISYGRWMPLLSVRVRVHGHSIRLMFDDGFWGTSVTGAAMLTYRAGQIRANLDLKRIEAGGDGDDEEDESDALRIERVTVDVLTVSQARQMRRQYEERMRRLEEEFELHQAYDWEDDE